MGDLETAYRVLTGADPVLAHLVERFGRPSPFTWAETYGVASGNFEAMALHIMGQQISTAAALTIYGRITAAVGGRLNPLAVWSLDVDELRSLGLSCAKAAYLHDLAGRQLTGALDLDGMASLDDAEAMAALTAVKGVGVWSAEMFLVHQLQRPDVLPAGDVGIRRAVKLSWRLPAMPTIEETRERALAWSPYRTYASALLWASLSEPVTVTA